MIDLRAIRNRVNKHRKRANFESTDITQSDIVKHLVAFGIRTSQTQVSRYERDSSRIPLDMLDAWLECLGTTLEEERQKTFVSMWITRR